MHADKKWFVLKLSTYIVLSYLMALISIGIIVFFSAGNTPEETTNGMAPALLRDIFNILFSTNACFISTTGWTVKKDSRPLEERSSQGDLVYLAMTSGLIVSAVFVVLSSVTEYFSVKVYSGGVIITFICCFYLAWIYTKEAVQKEKILTEHENDAYLRKAKEMMETKEEKSFNMAGTEYKI